MYIRTKDNAIYEIVNGNIIIGNLEVQIDSRKAIEEGNIIAYSIDKLCDCLVAVPPKGWTMNPFTLDINMLEEKDWVIEEMMREKGYEFYLSIWNSEHNLIKVAKVKPNLEVELCLN